MRGTPVEGGTMKSSQGSLAGPAPGVVLSVSGLTKVYEPSPPMLRLVLRSSIDEPVTALHDVSFDVEAGKICVIVGPNGAGKTTLFRLLTGLTTPTEGTATILGKDISAGPSVRALIGFMPAEDRNLMLRHTCIQNLQFRGRLQGVPEQELAGRIDEALELVGLSHAGSRAAAALSTGMKARLQLACAILHRPRLLILDEPTSTVDPVGAHELLVLIQDLASRQGISVVLSSHRLEEIDALDDQVVFLDKGSIIHNGDLGTLRAHWEEPLHRLRFTAAEDAEHAEKLLADAFPGLELSREEEVLEVATDESLGRLIAELGSTTARMESLEKVTMPLRALFAKLLSDEVEVQK